MLAKVIAIVLVSAIFVPDQCFGQDFAEEFRDRIDEFFLNHIQVSSICSFAVKQTTTQVTADEVREALVQGEVAMRSEPSAYRSNAVGITDEIILREHHLRSQGVQQFARSVDGKNFSRFDQVTHSGMLFEQTPCLFSLSPALWLRQRRVDDELKKFIEWEVLGKVEDEKRGDKFYLSSPSKRGGAIVQFKTEPNYLPMQLSTLHVRNKNQTVHSVQELEGCVEDYKTETVWKQFENYWYPVTVKLEMSSDRLRRGSSIEFEFSKWRFGDEVSKEMFEEESMKDGALQRFKPENLLGDG